MKDPKKKAPTPDEMRAKNYNSNYNGSEKLQANKSERNEVDQPLNKNLNCTSNSSKEEAKEWPEGFRAAEELKENDSVTRPGKDTGCIPAIYETEAVKIAVSCYDVLDMHQKDYRKGGSFSCPNSDHEDKHPSFSITPNGDHFKCHANCILGSGDCFDLEMFLSNCTFTEALESLAKYAGIPPKSRNGRKRGRQPIAIYFYKNKDGNADLLRVKKIPGKDYPHARPASKEEIERNQAFNPKTGMELKYKNGNQIRPDRDGWIPCLSGYELEVPYNFNLWHDSNDPIFIVEGEKDADRLTEFGFNATTNFGGAERRWPECFSEILKCRDVIILRDNDKPGIKSAKNKAESVVKYAKSVKCPVFEEFGEPTENHGKDVSDWLDSGKTKEDLELLVSQTPFYESTNNSNHSDVDDENKPEVLLPGNKSGVIKCATTLGKLLRNKGTLYIVDGSVHLLTEDFKLQRLMPAAANTIFEEVAKLTTLKGQKGKEVPVVTVCSKWQAEMILKSRAFLGQLPKVDSIVNAPVLFERAYGKVEAISGHNDQLRILAKNLQLPKIELSKAKDIILDALKDFQFQSEGDRSRAIAEMITPSLIFGGILKERAPLFSIEADKSRTGKGFLVKIISAIYNESPFRVVQRRGVGSVEESLSEAFRNGRHFVSFDNFRRSFESPALESLLTEDHFLARTPYSKGFSVDPSKFIFFLTSNQVELTNDLRKRSIFCRLLKQPGGYRFTPYPEGDILDHIKANQSLYMAAIYRIITEWVVNGKPKTQDTRHDNRGWLRPLDWIVQNLAGCDPLMDGHKEVQKQLEAKDLNWLHRIACAVNENCFLGEKLTPTKIAEICSQDNIDLAGLPSNGRKYEDCTDREKTQVWNHIGKRMKKIFQGVKEWEVDQFIVRRIEEPTFYKNSNKHDMQKKYVFLKKNGRIESEI